MATLFKMGCIYTQGVGVYITKGCIFQNWCMHTPFEKSVNKRGVYCDDIKSTIIFSTSNKLCRNWQYL